MKALFEKIPTIRPDPCLHVQIHRFRLAARHRALRQIISNALEIVHNRREGFCNTQAGISGNMSILWISAATPNSFPSPASTRTIRAWQHTQHFSPEVNSGGSISTSSTFAPSLMRDSVYRKTPFVLTSRVSALNSTFAPVLRTRTGNRAAILVPERRSILEFILGVH